MTETTTRPLPISDALIGRLRDFFGGRIYPAAVAASVLIGHVSGLEFYFAVAIVLAATLAFLVCDSVKHFIPTLLTFLYLVNLKHSPGFPTFSDYYSQPYVFITMAVLFSLLLLAAIYFTAVHLVPKMKCGKPPLLLPLSLLAAAFLLNGVLSSAWTAASLLFGFAEAAVYFLLFYLFYYGLKGERVNRLIDRVCYVALLAAAVLIGEVIFMYITNGEAIIADGYIHKEALSLGWGISNPAGCALVMLVPLLALGAMRSEYPLLYLCAALITSGATVLTLSRNALVVCLLVLTASFIIAYFMSSIKKLLGITLACAMGAVLIFALVFSEQLGELFIYFSRAGAEDSGRFELWKLSFDNFLSAPVFGRGFFDWGEMDVYEVADFVPTMSHNTFFQLLSSMGIFGFGSYVFYRVKSMLPFFRNISREKLMILFSIGALLLGSMLDNFMFYFQSVFLYVILLALVFIMDEHEQEWMLAHASDGDGSADADADEDDEDEDDDY